VIGWTTHGHNGETVPFWTHGANGRQDRHHRQHRPGHMAADAMDVDLDRATMNLYVDLDTVTDGLCDRRRQSWGIITLTGRRRRTADQQRLS
jgi:hypothetical protein